MNETTGLSTHGMQLSLHEKMASPPVPLSTLATAQKSLTFARVFARPDVHLFDEIEWETRDVAINEDGGAVVCTGCLPRRTLWCRPVLQPTSR